MVGRDIARLEKKPLLFHWTFTPAEWSLIVDALDISFPWKATLRFAIALPLGILAVWLFGMWRKADYSNLTLSNALPISMLFATLGFLLGAAVYGTHATRSFHPKINDHPICTITAEGIRLGDKVLWLKKCFVRRIAAVRNPVLGETVVLTSRYPISQEGGGLDVEILIPLPKSRPGLAREIAVTLAQELKIPANVG